MKKLLIVLIVLLSPALLRAEKEKYDAIVLEDCEQFTMSSLENGNLTVRRSVKVLNKNGLDAAVMIEYTDRSQTVSSFSAVITTDSGKKEILKKKNLVTVSLASGIAEDGFMTGYKPTPTDYPFTITYEYTIQFKNGFAVFPAFTPVKTARTRLDNASYLLTVPAGTRIRSYTTGNVPEATVTCGDKTDKHLWEFSYEGFVVEHNMPSLSELVPSVHASPDRFSYEGIPGSQDTWQSLGQWHSQLLKGTSQLPEATVAKVRDLTSGAATDLDKLRLLYRYLREKTRYVSIQFGIGGFRPFPASTVDKTGFGDCKALSNYFKALLSAAGISSEYTVLNTDWRDLMPGYVSFGQTNHAMLAIPLKEQGDTVWAECTNPTLPLGYRHDEIAGHEVILVKEDGGELVRVPSYPDSVRLRNLHLDVDLQEDGSASIQVRRKDSADEIEPWIGYDGLTAEDKRILLIGGLDGQAQNLSSATLSDNFDGYDGAGWIPWCEITYRFDMRMYGRRNGDRLMVPVNPFSKRLPVQRGDRIHPYVSLSTCGYADEIILHLPPGYSVESIPTDVSIDQVWGTFESRFRKEEGRIIITQSIRMKSCRESPDRYPEYREFVRTLNKAYSTSIVLRKNS